MGDTSNRRQVPLRVRYETLVARVRQDHAAQGAKGGSHDFLHALMVAQYCRLVAETERIGELAWVAAICHNTDRIFPDLGDGDIALKVNGYLRKEMDLTGRDVLLIVEAVINHHKPNDPADNPVTVVLKDADRVANMGPNNILRSGQFYADLPAYNPLYVIKPDPGATYRDPKTVLHDVLCSLEWYEEGGEFGIRLPKARKLAEKYATFLEFFRRLMLDQLEEAGLYPYPFPEDFEG